MHRGQERQLSPGGDGACAGIEKALVVGEIHPRTIANLTPCRWEVLGLDSVHRSCVHPHHLIFGEALAAVQGPFPKPPPQSTGRPPTLAFLCPVTGKIMHTYGAQSFRGLFSIQLRLTVYISFMAILQTINFTVVHFVPKWMLDPRVAWIASASPETPPTFGCGGVGVTKRAGPQIGAEIHACDGAEAPKSGAHLLCMSTALDAHM